MAPDREKIEFFGRPGGGTPAIAFAEEVTADEVSGGGSVEYSADTSSNSGSDTGSADTGSGSSSSGSSETNSGSNNTSGSGTAGAAATGSGESVDTDDEEATTDENEDEETSAVSLHGETVNTDGDVHHALSSDEGSVTNVNGDAAEASASDGGTVNVNGDVSESAYISNGGTINVNGNAEQVMIDEGGTVNVNGDGKKNGDVADGIDLFTTADNKNIIYVNGTVSSRAADIAPIRIYGYGYDDATILENNQITAWKIEPNTDGEYVWVYTSDDGTEEGTTINKELSKKVEAAIQYIIKKGSSDFSLYDEEGDEVETGTAGQNIIIKVDNDYDADDYDLLAATNVDGNTWKILIPAGGGVTVEYAGRGDGAGTEANPGTSGTVGKGDIVGTETNVIPLASVSEEVTASDAVETGDTNNALPYALALIASAAGITLVVRKKKASRV